MRNADTELKYSPNKPLPTLVLVPGYYCILFFLLRPLVIWISCSTPVKAPIEENHSTAILCIVMGNGFSCRVCWRTCLAWCFCVRPVFAKSANIRHKLNKKAWYSLYWVATSTLMHCQGVQHTFLFHGKNVYSKNGDRHFCWLHWQVHWHHFAIDLL